MTKADRSRIGPEEKTLQVSEIDVTQYVRMLSAALPSAGRSIFILCTLLCTVHACEGLASYTLTPSAEGMQLKTPQGQIVFEYKTKIPANLHSPGAQYFDSLNTPSGDRVSNAAPDDHPWHRGISLGTRPSGMSTPLLTIPPTRDLRRRDSLG